MKNVRMTNLLLSVIALCLIVLAGEALTGREAFGQTDGPMKVVITDRSGNIFAGVNMRNGLSVNVENFDENR